MAALALLLLVVFGAQTALLYELSDAYKAAIEQRQQLGRRAAP